MTAEHVRTNVRIGSACFGGNVHPGFAASLLDLATACEQRGVGFGWHFHEGDAMLARARAACVAAFLADPAATHLLIADADLVFAQPSLSPSMSPSPPIQTAPDPSPYKRMFGILQRPTTKTYCNTSLNGGLAFNELNVNLFKGEAK